MMFELYRRAETQLRKQRRSQRSKAGDPKLETDPQRLLHGLQVHQVELEIQNTELEEARNRLEALVEKYTDLYDFAPVGYFTLDEQGRILEVNLMGAASLGVQRSLLIHRLLPHFVTPTSRPDFLAFLGRLFTETGKQFCEVELWKKDSAALLARFQGTSALSTSGPRKWCRVAFSDITAQKQVEAAHRRIEELAASNRKLEQEIARREAVEESLRKSEQHQSRLLEQAHQMQEQLRQLSRQVLQAQEQERKRISRELHDVVAQTLTGINIRLGVLKNKAAINAGSFTRSIASTQRLVEKSVEIVHQFARELRPAVLDDLGLIPALQSFLKSFTARTGVHARLAAFRGVEQLDMAYRTVFFRVAQEALTNVGRHARASRVDVDIQKLPDGICMKIKDDGKSFCVERALHSRADERLGLLGMRERLEMVGGSFAIESAPGQGTTVLARIPLGNAAREAGGVR